MVVSSIQAIRKKLQGFLISPTPFIRPVHLTFLHLIITVSITTFRRVGTNSEKHPRWRKCVWKMVAIVRRNKYSSERKARLKNYFRVSIIKVSLLSQKQSRRRHYCPSTPHTFVMSVRTYQRSFPPDGFSRRLILRGFSRKFLEKIKICLKSDKISATSYEDQSTTAVRDNSFANSTKGTHYCISRTTYPYYIVHSYMLINDNNNVSVVTIVTRSRHNILLYPHDHLL
jgi:hypothetical protein